MLYLILNIILFQFFLEIPKTCKIFQREEELYEKVV